MRGSKSRRNPLWPAGVKATTRVVRSTRAQSRSTNCARKARPRLPARCERRSLQSRHSRQRVERPAARLSMSMPKSIAKSRPFSVRRNSFSSTSRRPSCQKAVEHLHAHFAGQVIVADAGSSQPLVPRPLAAAQMSSASGEAHQSLQHARHVGRSEGEILVASLLAQTDEPAFEKPREMGAGSLTGHSGFGGQFRCRERPCRSSGRSACSQRAGSADQGSNAGDIGTFFHTSMVTEAWAIGNPLP